MATKKQRCFWQRVITLCLAATLLFTSVWYDTPQVYAKSKQSLTGMNAQEIVKQIKVGWNLGNAMDCTTETTNPTPKDTVTAWGSPEPTEELIDRVNKTGFNGIRIPVTWYQHITFDETKNQYVIDDDWMEYVQKIVDWAYDRDMFIILNLHHEDWVNEKIWTDETLKTATQKMQDIWTQIAERFKDYDQHLIFEAMNEPRQTGNPDVAEWGDGNEYSLNYINTLNQTFVNVIRSSDSRANKERLLMIPTYDATASVNALKPLEIPENAGNIAISVHAYSPYSFAMDADEEQHIYEPGQKDRWGNDVVASLKATMDGLGQIEKEKKVPIIIGEFGASDFGNQNERVKWAEDYLTQAVNYNIPCFLWDNNVVHEEGDQLTGEKYGFINRADNKLYSNNIDVLKKIMEVVGVTDAEFPVSVPDTTMDPFWDTFQTGSDWITVKKFNIGEKIKDYGGSTLTSNLKYVKKGYRLAVVYEGTTAPKLICVDKNWTWLNGVCAAKDSTKNIAYFDYVDIAEVLDGHDLSDIANLTAQAQGADTTIYGLFAVPYEQADNPFWEKVTVPNNWIKLCRFPNGQDLASYKEANCGTNGFQYATKDYRFAVLYEGEMAPQLVFIDKDWKYLPGILPTSDSVENIAYFSYEDVKKALGDKTEINDIRVQARDKKVTVYGLYAVPLDTESEDKPSEGEKPSKPSEAGEPTQPSEGSEPSQPSEASKPSKPSEDNKPSGDKITGLDAQEIIKQIKIGWNLGNSLDSTTSKENPTPKDTATAWGNPEPTEELIERVKKTGFNGIRIPVTWYQHLQFDQEKNEYVIDKDWMDYVQQVVDWAYERDMYIILNIHHEEWINAKVWNDETFADSSRKMHDIWTQIAERFKNYDQHLIFEAMNEPRQTGNPEVAEWGNGNEYSIDYINKLNQIFVDVIRGSSEQNKERLLMIPTYDATGSIDALRPLKIPENAGNIALSVHAYTPYSFAMKVDEAHVYEKGAKDEWGADIVQTLKNAMDDLHKISEEKNVPIIIGEFGASDFGNQEERVKWAEDYLTQASAYGIPCFLWDNNVVHYDGDTLTSEKYGCINRSNNMLYPNNVNVLKKMMEVVGVKDAVFDVPQADLFWDSFQPGKDWITIRKLLNGEKIEDYQGYTLLSNLKYVQKGYRLAVAYEGTVLPKLVCVEHVGENWNWLNGVCAAKDSTKQIAYFDYADIAESLEGHDLANIANLTVQAQGAETTIYGVFAVPHEEVENPFWEKVSVPNDWVKLCRFPNGQDLASYKEANCGTGGMQYVTKDNRFAVLYEGDMAPQMIFIDKDWNYLDGILPASDSVEHIAYFDYEDIKKVIGDKKEADINDIRVQAREKGVTVYGLYAVPGTSVAPSEKPSEGSQPLQPSVNPSEASKPTDPSKGSAPEEPSKASEPIVPSRESEPSKVSEPIVPSRESNPSGESEPSKESKPTSPSKEDTSTPSKGSEPAVPSVGKPSVPSKGSEASVPSKGSTPSGTSDVSTPQNPEPSKKPSTIAVEKLTLEREELELKKGEKEQIRYTIQPSNATNQKLVWSSSKKEVALVNSSGMVYAVAAGEAIISVTTEDGTKQANCKVTVTDGNSAPSVAPQVTSLKANKPNLTLATNKTFALKITIKPSALSGAPLTYKSAKKSVAKVSSSGVIKAVAPGKSTITIESENGKQAKVNVKVVPAKVSGVSAKQPAKGQIKVTWKKQSGISQYQISYYDPKKGSYTKPKTVSKNRYTLKNCKKNATYKCKVRAIKKKGGITYYGEYSSVVKIKTKK